MEASTPSRLIKLAQKLFPNDSDEQQRFISALEHPLEIPDALLCFQNSETDASKILPFESMPPRPEQPDCVTRIHPGQNPGRHAMHDDGAYYCLDYSSVIAAVPLLEVVPLPDGSGPDLVVDVCAAPGGKSLLAWSLLHPRRMVANEVVQKRISAMASNFKRCHVSSAKIENLFPNILAKKYESEADVVLVDAPCSGQSMLAKGEKAQGCFFPSVINGNSNRQKRILAECSPLVKGGGHLLYSTCTFAREENENVIEWFVKRFSDFEAVTIKRLEGFKSAHTDIPCYRVFPQSGLGAGAFTCLLKKKT